MRTRLLIGCLAGLVGVLLVVGASYAAGSAHSAAVTRHCGSFRYGADGSPPGPSRITARNVSCRFARSLALRGGARGWHCHLAMGLKFVCRPVRGHGLVTFLGE